MPEKVHTSIPSDTPLAKSLDRNLVMLKGITGGSSDVIIKTGTLCGARIAVITCEGMADTDTLAQLIYKKAERRRKFRKATAGGDNVAAVRRLADSRRAA